ncbi:MAG TPA: T9SS type A sorting domain-containing protein, partial [Bacteroidales bacterium]
SCIGETLQFTDLTKFSPIQWEWQFDPPTVTFVNGSDQFSQNPEVVFEDATAYSVTLTTWNLNGESDITKFDFVNSGGYVPYFKETFETESFRSNEWTIQNPDNEITWKLHEIGGNGPGNLAMGVDMSHYFAIGQRDRLTSPPFNFTNFSSAAIDMQYAYAKRIQDISDSLIIKISTDCGETWTRIFAGGDDNSGNFATHEPVADGSFWPKYYWDWCSAGYGASCISLDLTPWAGQANVQLQFETWSAYGNPIFIDNIEISQFVGQEENAGKNEELLIFPNPSKGIFHIVLPSDRNINQIQLLNQLGQVVYTNPISEGTNRVDIQLSLKPGIYFLNAQGETNMISKKVIVY